MFSPAGAAGRRPPIAFARPLAPLGDNALAFSMRMFNPAGKRRQFSREGKLEPRARRLPWSLRPRDGLSTQSPFLHLRAPRGAPDLPRGGNAGPYPRRRGEALSGRGCGDRGQPRAPHNFLPTDIDGGALFFVLYVNADWFTPNAADRRGLWFGQSRIAQPAAIDRHVRRAATMVCGAPSLSDLDGELRQLIAACHEESWLQSSPAGEGLASITDFRVRKSIKLLSDAAGSEIALDSIAREAGAVATAVLQAFPRPDRGDAASLSQHLVDGESARRAGGDRRADRRNRRRSRLLRAQRVHPLLRRTRGHGADGLSPRGVSVAKLTRAAGGRRPR